MLLVLQRRERWAEIPALEALYTRTLPAVVEWVLPLFVLELALHPKQQQQIAAEDSKDVLWGSAFAPGGARQRGGLL